jgi:hypothetical protein
MPDDLTSWAWLVCAASTWAMTGLIWFVQLVHYPLMALVGSGGYERYQAAHQSRTTIIVAPLMLAQAASSGVLAWRLQDAPQGVAAWAGLALVALVFASTFFVQVPLHARLARGFDAGVHRRLVTTNWLRTLLWTAHALVVLLAKPEATAVMA